MSAMPHRFAGHLGLRAPDRPLLRHLAGSGDPIVQIELLADRGFAGVQDNFLVLRPPEQQERIGAAIARRGLAMGSFVHDPLAWNRPTWSAVDADGRAALLAEVERTIECARRVGGRHITCITGFDPGRSRAEQLAAMAGNLARAGDFAARAGLTLCVEATAPDFVPGMLVESSADAIAVADRAGHEAVALVLDAGHCAMNGEDVPTAIRRAGRRIAVVQIADVPGRIDPGAGALDWPAIFAALAEIGHAGLIEIEHEPMEDSAAGERALLERLQTLPRKN